MPTPKPADYFAPAVLGKMLEDRLKGQGKPPVPPIDRMRGDGPDAEPDADVDDMLGPPVEVVQGLPMVRRPRIILPEPLPVPQPRFVRGAQADRWEPK